MSNNPETEDKLTSLKEELLKAITETENRLNLQINKSHQNSEYTSKLDHVIQFNKDTEQRIRDLQEFNALVKVKVMDNMGDYSTFKTNIGEDIFSQSVKMNNIQKDLTIITNKFDKMFTDNLIITGTMGNEGCKYKNLREFIEVITF